jgi:hypothetical protein
MDRKYLSAPFDMSEYIFGERFVLGGIDFDLDDKDEKSKEEDDKNPEPLTPSQGR